LGYGGAGWSSSWNIYIGAFVPLAREGRTAVSLLGLDFIGLAEEVFRLPLATGFRIPLAEIA
jgi:hypothetical protein